MWQDLLDERKKRDQQRFASTGPRSFFDSSTSNQPDTEDDGGFFGKLLHPVRQAAEDVGGAAQAVGGFFGGMAKDFVDTTVEGAKTARDIVASPIKTHAAGELTDQAIKLNQEWSKKTANWTEADYNDPANKAEAQRHQEQVKALNDRSRSLTESDTIKDRDAKKSAAAAGETFINAATLGAGTVIENLAKGTLKQGAKAVAEETLKNGVKSGAKLAAKKTLASGTKEIAETGGKAALKTVGKNTAEGALYGGSYGGLETLRKEGDNASTDDILHSALLGSLMGGGLGVAGSALNRNVRTEAAQLPGRAGESLGTLADNLGQANRNFGEVGGGRPFTRLSDTKPLNNTDARPQAELQRQLEEAHNAGDTAREAEIAAQIDDPGMTAQAVSPERRAELMASMRSGGFAAETPAWAPDNVFNELTPEAQSRQSLIESVASEYQSPEQFVEDTARAARAFDDSARGGQLQKVEDTTGSQYSRTTEHSPWYRQFYAENGRKPSYKDAKNAVQEALEGTGPGHSFVSPDEVEVYRMLKERQGATDALVNDPTAPLRAGATDQGDEFQQLLSGTRGTGTIQPTRNPGWLPKGPSGTSPLPGLEPEAGTLQPRYDDPAALQAALGRGEAQTNPLVDYIDPRARVASPEAVQGELPVNAPRNPYEGMQQDLNTLALPQGKLPDAPTPAQAKRMVKSGQDAPAEVLNKQRDGNRTIELPATSEEMRDIATKTTKNGKVVTVATNNAHPTTGYVDAVRAIAADDTGSRFTNTRTPELNLEEATAKRGGTQSKEFKELNQNNIELREATARQSDYIQKQKAEANAFVKKYKWNPKKDVAARQYIEAETAEARESALVGFKKEFGDDTAAGLQELDAKWKADKDRLRTEANEVIERYAGKERTIGDLGASYLPRVYKKPGLKGFRDSVLDVAHSGLDKIGGKDGLLNLENPSGYLSKETESAGTGLRSVNQAPLNSDLAKPNTSFLSAAQKRTARDPQGELEGALASIVRYHDAVSRAKEFTPVIAKGRSQQKVIELVNGETGNLRQMYDSLNDQLNAVSGKTSSFDQKFVNTKTGNQFVNIATKLQSRISRSTIVGSANSAIAQTGQLPLIFAENGPKNFAQGMADVMKSVRSKSSEIEQSAFMRTRYPENESPFTTKVSERAGQKATEVIAKPFHIIEQASSKLAWYSSLARAKAEGLVGKEAIQEADRMTAKIIGERSPGARAALYESKALAPVSAYTLEVNQMYQIAKQYFKRDPKRAASLVGAIWLYNQGYKAVTGNKLNADPLQATLDAKDILTNQDITDENGDPIGMSERLARATGRIAGEAVDATPLGGQVAGQLYPENGFRVPFGSGERMLSKSDIFGDTNVGRYGAGPPIAAGISNPLLLLGIPGMAQLQRSVEGNRAFQEGGVYNKDGEAKFEIDNTDPSNQWRALIWGMYGTPEGRAYLAAQQARLAGRSVE